VTRGLYVNGRAAHVGIRMANRWWQRLVGLLTTPDLDHPSGLWITPCNSVHTLGMRYAIDVLFLDADGRVIKRVDHLRPWRASSCLRARATLELRAGLAEELDVQVGQRMALFP
jgi:uncharacterized membrane protein (UPF0127 family)